MIKTIILNQATLHPDYKDVDDIAYTTWGSTQNPNVRPIHYYGKYDINQNPTDKFLTLPEDGQVIMNGDNVMIIGTYDNTYPANHPRHSIIPDARNEKFILALEYCLNNFEFDYIQRICNTSYVDVEKMTAYFERLPRTKIYNGARNLYNYEYFFVAGHNVFMSYDVVKLLVEHKEEYLASSYPEDLIAGKIIMYDAKYVNFDDQSQANTGTTITSENIEDIQIHHCQLSINLPYYWGICRKLFVLGYRILFFVLVS
jgi:hypothetical protein